MASDYDPNGPAVILGNAESLFPNQLAAEWKSRRLDVAIVTSTSGGVSELPEGIPLIRSQDFRKPWMRWIRGLNLVLRPLERHAVSWNKGRYRRRTGKREPEPWEWYWVDHFWDSFSRARAALSLRPRFVFAQEASSYGLATALCRGIPRIVFPWGGDVFIYAETSPFLFAITRYALKKADLIVPSSTTAAQHICDRFGIPESKVQPVSWGVDREQFQKATPQQRAAVCMELGIDPQAVIVLNARRFVPLWGAYSVLEAFLKVARQEPGTHFILLGGPGTEADLRQAADRIAIAGLESRFTLFPGEIPLTECARLMSIADIFLSVMGIGDMQSASVLQAAASGGAPVVRNTVEHREMIRCGFAAVLVESDEADEIAAAVQSLVQNDSQRQEIARRNNRYLADQEDYPTQMTRLLELIDDVCSRYRTNA